MVTGVISNTFGSNPAAHCAAMCGRGIRPADHGSIHAPAVSVRILDPHSAVHALRRGTRTVGRNKWAKASGVVSWPVDPASCSGCRSLLSSRGVGLSSGRILLPSFSG